MSGDLDRLVREDPGIVGAQASDAARRWVETSVRIDPRDGGAWAIVHRLSARTIGMVAYCARDRGGPVEISYMLVPKWRGKGAGPEAVAPVIAYLFEDLGARTLFADVALDNIASIKLLCGFGFSLHPAFESGLSVGLEPQVAARWRLEAGIWQAVSRHKTASA
jgi:RimJ/RimL family protein N-acetyltransferase